ncbi:MAG: AarF/UbiB family protein [Phycisphaerae bacterium]|nr:AarF/UbiB family protein [Phycisphaerae bacterium]
MKLRHFRFGRTIKHLRRYHHIARVLMKHGLGELAGGLRHRVSLRIRTGVTLKQPMRNGLSRPQRLRLALEELGPTFVKFGQLLSTRPDLLRPDYIEELEKLQDQVPPEDFDRVRTDMESQLGGPLEDFFPQLDAQPIAAGSIAQVYRATTRDGRIAAVKVRRPGIVHVIRTECEILEGFAGLVNSTMEDTHGIDPVRVIREFTQAVTREVDFQNELANLRQFRRNFRDDATVHIPRPYEDYCRDGIITMEFMHGVKPTVAASLAEAGLDPQVVARTVSGFILKQIFDFGFFHTDPHPGNLFVEANNVVAVVDFGQAARLTRSDRALLGEVILAVVDVSASRLVRAFGHGGMLDDTPSLPALTRELDVMLETYHDLPMGEIPFSHIMHQTFAIIREHRVHPPPEFTMMLKSLMVSESMARSLHSEFTLIEHLRPYAARLRCRQLDPRRVVRRGYGTLRDVAGLMESLPDDVSTIVEKLKTGQVRIHLEHEHLDSLVRMLDISSNRVSFGMVIAGLLVASSLLVQRPEEFIMGLASLQTFGMIGYLLAAILGLWLVVSIIRSRKV